MYPTPYVRVWVCLVPQECKQSEDLPPGGQETMKQWERASSEDLSGQASPNENLRERSRYFFH